MSNPVDLCDTFAAHVSNTGYDRLPGGAIDAAKKSVLDALGVILAASGMEPAVQAVVNLVRESGGRPESTLLGFGERLPAAAAALANGAMAHCLDFDDRTRLGAHAGSSLMPAALALAEREGSVSGKRLIAGIAAGQDLFIRMRSNVKWNHDWNLSTVVGVFSATATASYILGLTREQTANAFGIASMQASGTMQPIYGGSHLRGMYGGFSASTAVNAALLAQKGLTGIDGVFEGKAGIFTVYFDGKYDRERMLSRLGQDYLGSEMLYKPWPVVGIAHTYIHATIELMREHGLAAEDIEEIRAHVSEYQNQIAEPLDRRRKPETAVDAKYSLHYCVALSAVRGRVEIADFSAEALCDTQVLAMARRVAAVKVTGDAWKSDVREGLVEIVTRDGRTLSRLGDNVPGSPEAPMTWDDVAMKFRSCAAASAVPIAGVKIDRTVELVSRLEDLDDVARVIAALT